MNLKHLLNDFVICHDGQLNKIIHLFGFAMIGIGIIEKSLVYVIVGAIIQELGHFYQYFKTKQYRHSPLACIKPQSVLAYPVFIMIVLYVLLSK